MFNTTGIRLCNGMFVVFSFKALSVILYYRVVFIRLYESYISPSRLI